MGTPLTPKDCDLRDFQFMPLDIVRMFGSRFHAICSDAEWRAGVTLWLKSFHQIPAASLPDDDVELCRLAELGRDIKTWKKVKANALHGWIKCDDGRLYHKVVAEKANEAWARKQLQRERSKKGNAARWGARDHHENESGRCQGVQEANGKTDEISGEGLPEGLPEASLKDSHKDRKGQGQGQGQGQGLEKQIGGGNACAPAFPYADFPDGDPDNRPRIPMTADWQPGSTFLTDRAAYGFRPDSFSAENLAEFRGYWAAKPDRITQAEWEHRLAVRLKELSSRPPSRASPSRRSTPQPDNFRQKDYTAGIAADGSF